jgi:hypothetical protein
VRAVPGAQRDKAVMLDQAKAVSPEPDPLAALGGLPVAAPIERCLP